MKSKEAVKLAKIEFKKDFEDGEETNQWLKDVIKGLEEAEKDLELLEILKNHIHLKEDTLTIDSPVFSNFNEITSEKKNTDIAWVEASGFVFRNSDEYELLKEWTDLNIKEVSGQINTTNTDKRVGINSRLVGCSIDNNCVKMSDDLKEKFKALRKDIMATTTINSNFKDFEINSSPPKTIISCEGYVTHVNMNKYDSEEIIENCTVKIWSNSDTGNIKIGWWKNDK